MRAALARRLTFANVMSCAAVFIALGGGAYALSIPKNSVGSKQLRKNAVTATKIKRSAVTSSKVKDKSLLAKDFKSGQLPAGKQGPQGPPGPSTGPAGGALAGTYPNPTLSARSVGPAAWGTTPSVAVQNANGQAIAANVDTELSFPSENFDTMGMHTPAFPGRLQAPIDGVYVVTANVSWTAGGGTRQMEILRNADTTNGIAASRITATGSVTQDSVSGIVKLAQGDTVRVNVNSSIGTTVLGSGQNGAPRFGMVWVGNGT